MVKKIIISHLNNIAAIIHNSKIQELIINRDKYHVHDIYIGIVQKIFTSINAAFLKLNYSEKSGFIHVSDTKYLYSLKYSHLNNISEVLSIKQKVLVQIIKEPTITKGPRLTTNIHLSGQYVILMPLNNTICIGQNIYDENERSFLRALGILVKPFGMGILFKKNSIGVEEKILINDIRNLGHRWNFIEKSAIGTSCPKLIYNDNNIVQKVLRDYFNSSITVLVTDSKSCLKQIHEYLISHHINITDQKISVQLYKSDTCILEKFDINSIMFNMLKPKVELNSGIHIVIESSEALTTIDVNSGSFNQNGKIYDSVLHTNCLAATEIGYQIKIRNINGIIIIDFIDMKSHQDQLTLLEHLNKILLHDEAKPEIIQLSELGLVELTRRRRGQSIKEIFTETDQYSSNNNPNHIAFNQNMDIVKYKPEINSIFFKKQFQHYHQIKENNLKAAKFISLKNQHIIPLDLYYSTIDQTIGYN
uniref:Ribonuclease E n=1 Tax=Helminthora furcellata TaxID=1884666 RepID=A0A1G4NYZ5_9FLOR|nr:Ribonuclease E [Helminthora furcellata]SCW21051.1 Ribonuclease E [Helminthora furcellata]SCW23911.1 Ribonuclease E [Helminthora furcellata]